MSTQNDFTRAFTVNTAMSAWRRVSVSSNGALDLAAIGTLGVGIIQEDTDGSAFTNPKVRLYGTGSAQISVTAQPVTPGSTLYAVTAGQVAPTNGATGGQAVGIALQGSVNNGDVIEFLPQF